MRRNADGLDDGLGVGWGVGGITHYFFFASLLICHSIVGAFHLHPILAPPPAELSVAWPLWWNRQILDGVTGLSGQDGNVKDNSDRQIVSIGCK